MGNVKRRLSSAIWLPFFCSVVIDAGTVDVVHEREITVEAPGIIAENGTGGSKRSSTPTRLTTEEHGQRQIEWVRSHGAFVHSSFEIRREDPLDPTSRYGVYAKTDIANSELILSIPRKCLITPKGEASDVCGTVEALADEMQLGEESFYEPYVSYLKTQTSGGQLPTMWSVQGKEFLLELLGWTSETGGVTIPPFNVIQAGHDCSETNDYSEVANMLVIQRSWDEILIPVWDMVSHRNGHWTNVAEAYSVFDEQHPVTVKATRDIKAGEELFMSYDHCPDCQGRLRTYGTPEILRDYGFVEMFPQKWVFHGYGVSIGLDYNYKLKETGGRFDDDKLLFQWYSRPASPRAVSYFKSEIERLLQMDVATKPQQIPSHEWEVAVVYHAAILRAMRRVVLESELLSTVANDKTPALFDQCQRDLEASQNRLQEASASVASLMEQIKALYNEADELRRQLASHAQDSVSE